MISKIRTHLEDNLEVPVHFVHLIQGEALPCATIRQVSADHRETLKGATSYRIIEVSVGLWAMSYLELEALAESLYDLYDTSSANCGLEIEGVDSRISVTDAEDDSFVNPDGSDDWIYQKEVRLKVHYKK